MTEPPTDDRYFSYLLDLVGEPNGNHHALLRLLFQKEFTWIVPNDDNRVEDGLDVRVEFADQITEEYPDRDWMLLGCSFFEVLVGLSRRLSFLVDREPRDWFWTLIVNLNLDGYTGRLTRAQEKRVNNILDRAIWRTYDADGLGGLFPLERPSKDQRKVELWYQLSEYLLELEEF
jgi:hypothetical protein